MYKNKLFLLVLSSFLLVQFSSSQNNTNSPYTRFGYGDISDTNNGEQRAMGGISIGSRSSTNINTVNPASYSAVDSLNFMFDIGGSALISKFSESGKKVTKNNANLEYITMQFPLAKWLGFSAGVLPYSFLGYDFYKKDTVTIPNTTALDSVGTTRSFVGSGGFTQVYTGLSAKLFNHLALGVNVYYMFGTVNNLRDLSFSSTTTNSISSSDFLSTTQTNTIRANNFRFRFGAQYFNTFNKKHDVTLGVIYEPKKAMNGSFTQTTYSAGDTTINNVSGFDLPTVYGVGVNYCYNKRFTVGVDYSMQEWKNAKFFGKTDSLSNRSKLAVGIQYQPNPTGRFFSDRIRYRAGFNVSDSYYKVEGVTPPKNYSATCGVGLPIYSRATNSISMLNLSFEYGKIGSTVLKENYYKITMSLTFNEHWFVKRKL
jgi:hypothetical protein